MTADRWGDNRIACLVVSVDAFRDVEREQGIPNENPVSSRQSIARERAGWSRPVISTRFSSGWQTAGVGGNEPPRPSSSTAGLWFRCAENALALILPTLPLRTPGSHPFLDGSRTGRRGSTPRQKSVGSHDGYPLFVRGPAVTCRFAKKLVVALFVGFTDFWQRGSHCRVIRRH